jgi:uncharacterized integral membrane protein
MLSRRFAARVGLVSLLVTFVSFSATALDLENVTGVTGWPLLAMALVACVALSAVIVLSWQAVMLVAERMDRKRLGSATFLLFTHVGLWLGVQVIRATTIKFGFLPASFVAPVLGAAVTGLMLMALGHLTPSQVRSDA